MIQRLITDRDVLSGSVHSPIVLDEHTLLTPAARDRAVQKGLVIVERGAVAPADPRSASGGPPGTASCSTCGGCEGCEGCGGCRGGAAGCGCRTGGGDGIATETRPGAATGTGHPPSAALSTLPDGLHLVRVEGGRVVSALPAAGPGLMQPARGGSTS